jgi:purine-binding chemotaxis protein CheW
METKTVTPARQCVNIADTPLTIVSFQLGPQQYGLPIEAVREIVRLPALIALTGAPPALCGLLNLRGFYLPVLDGRVLVGETPHYTLNSQIMLVGHSRPKLGLLVDQVERVTTLPRASRTPIQRGVAAPLLDSVIDDPQGAIILLDLAVLVALAAEGQQAAVEQAVAVMVDQS